MFTILREDLAAILRNSVAVVTFVKKNGELRKMKCTLKEDVLPDLVGTKRKRNYDVLPVWDLEKNAWRSFRLDSIENVEVIDA
jgi:hypothetical protein